MEGPKTCENPKLREAKTGIQEFNIAKPATKIFRGKELALFSSIIFILLGDIIFALLDNIVFILLFSLLNFIESADLNIINFNTKQ